MSEATKRPWELADDPTEVLARDGEDWIADCDRLNGLSREECEANAALIVHCINNHDALVAALEEIANHPESKKGTAIDGSSYAVGWAFWNVQQIAKAALAQAKGAAS